MCCIYLCIYLIGKSGWMKYVLKNISNIVDPSSSHGFCKVTNFSFYFQCSMYMLGQTAKYNSSFPLFCISSLSLFQLLLFLSKRIYIADIKRDWTNFFAVFLMSFCLLGFVTLPAFTFSPFNIFFYRKRLFDQKWLYGLGSSFVF